VPRLFRLASNRVAWASASDSAMTFEDANDRWHPVDGGRLLTCNDDLTHALSGTVSKRRADWESSALEAVTPPRCRPSPLGGRRLARAASLRVIASTRRVTARATADRQRGRDRAAGEGCSEGAATRGWVWLTLMRAGQHKLRQLAQFLRIGRCRAAKLVESCHKLRQAPWQAEGVRPPGGRGRR